MRRLFGSIGVRPRRWAVFLPVVHALVYGVLVALSRPPKAEGVFDSIDYPTPLAARVILSLDAPPLLWLHHLLSSWIAWSFGLS